MNKFVKNIHPIQECFPDGKLMSLYRMQLNQEHLVNVIMEQIKKYYSDFENDIFDWIMEKKK